MPATLTPYHQFSTQSQILLLKIKFTSLEESSYLAFHCKFIIQFKLLAVTCRIWPSSPIIPLLHHHYVPASDTKLTPALGPVPESSALNLPQPSSSLWIRTWFKCSLYRKTILNYPVWSGSALCSSIPLQTHLVGVILFVKEVSSITSMLTGGNSIRVGNLICLNSLQHCSIE